MAKLEQHIGPAIETVELSLGQSGKMLANGKPTIALWFLFRAFQELEEAEVIIAAYDLEARR